MKTALKIMLIGLLCSLFTGCVVVPARQVYLGPGYRTCAYCEPGSVHYVPEGGVVHRPSDWR
jgi:hypothetical protein